MRAYGGTMRRMTAALVFTVLMAGACGGSDESQGRAFEGTRATDDTTTTTQVAGASVEGVQVTPSVPVVPVTPAPLPPPVTASSGRRGVWPHRGRGCRRAPYPKCSQTTRRPCCQPGDPANTRFRGLRPAPA
jgi:hypothetical protein